MSYVLVQIVWFFKNPIHTNFCLYNQLFDFLNSGTSSYLYLKPPFSSWKISRLHATQGHHMFIYLEIFSHPHNSSLSINYISKETYSLTTLTALVLSSQSILHLLISSTYHKLSSRINLLVHLSVDCLSCYILATWVQSPCPIKPVCPHMTKSKWRKNLWAKK